MSKPSLVMAVLEDDHHRRLIYRYLIECGLKTHEVRIERSPSGEGSAENWLRSRFVREVRVCRTRHAQTALIVMIDADTISSHARLIQLARALSDVDEQPIAADERVARLVPKRNVETWILCLNGKRVDENTDYKRRHDWSELIPQWLRSFYSGLGRVVFPRIVLPH
jgi:hypothetical protein